MKTIKHMIWFLRESRSFVNASIPNIVFKQQGIKRAWYFAKNMLHDEKMAKIHGAQRYYAMQDRVI